MFFLRFTGQKNHIDSLGNKELGNNIISVVDMPWRFHKSVLSKVCHFHLSSSVNSRVRLPFKRIWYKGILKKLPQNVASCIVINAHLYSFGDKHLLSYVRDNYPKCKIVFLFSDKYDYYIRTYKRFPSIEELRNEYDLVLSYNSMDCQKYNIEMIRPLMPEYSLIRNDDAIEDSDILFVGQNKGRLNDLIHIYEICTSAGLKCEFYISGVAPEDQVYPERIVYNQWMPYSEVLKRVKKTKCVVDLQQKGSSGITMREYEAFGNDKCLLTDNYFLQNTEFYFEDQIIWYRDFEKNLSKIKNEFYRSPFFYEHYNESQWYIWLEERLKAR